MQADTFAVIAIIGLLVVAALVLWFLLHTRRSAATDDRIDEPRSGAKPRMRRGARDEPPAPR